MPIGGIGGQLMPVLRTAFTVIQVGIVASSAGYLLYLTWGRLAGYTRIEEPDPTIFKRQFEMFFDKRFAPIGWTVANRTKSPVLRPFSYYLSISFAVILGALLSYLVTGSVIATTVVATHHTLGIGITLMPLLRTVVAFVVLVALAIIFHAGDRANQIPA